MPTFYLLDHSLKGVGGHHFDYAYQVLHAAQTAGFEIVLATNRRFHDRHRMPAEWSVESPFRHTTYCRFALYASSGSRTLSSARRLDSPPAEQRTGVVDVLRHPDAWLPLLLGKMTQWSRARRIRQFAHACRHVFRKHPLGTGDQVFLPTLSEFDLHGLSAYLAGDATSLTADWHLQFHYNVFEGREPEYTEQPERLEALRRELVTALRPLGRHRLHFYNTASRLADQYNRLGLGRFRELTYPIGDAFRAQSRGAAREPLRVTCPGAVRQEKGQPLLSDILRRLWDDQFSTGKLQLVVQSNKSWFRIPLPESDQRKTPPREPVIYVPHPLSPREYVELVRQADIGLLMYDSRRYYARRAGILGELLSAGVPVIVPAGCWLSQQIAEAALRHREQLEQHWPVVARRSLAATCQMPPLPGLSGLGPKGTRPTVVGIQTPARLGPETGVTEMRIDVPEGATDVVIHWGWGPIEKPGSHLRVCGFWEPLGSEHDMRPVKDGGGASDPSWSEIVATWNGKGNPRSSVAVACPDSSRQLRLQWSNAYEQGGIQLKDLGCTFLDASKAVGGHCPTSAVGLIAADQGDVPRLLREMATHFGHYRATARAFSRRWRAAHTADRTVAQLLAAAAVACPAAA
jgi:hypothetical protein